MFSVYAPFRNSLSDIELYSGPGSDPHGPAGELRRIMFHTMTHPDALKRLDRARLTLH